MADKIANVNKNNPPFSRFLSKVFLGLCTILSPLLHCKSRQSEAFKTQKKRGAMLVLCNHLSAYDFIHFASQMHPAPLNFVVAENMMYSSAVFAKLIKGYHAITKKQYYADVQCIKSIKRYLDAGISVLIAPEGKVSANGVTGAIIPSIARLVQWLGYPVGVIKLRGASIARPKWAYKLKLTRRGSVYADCDMLFAQEQVKTLSKEQILDEIRTALEHNEHEWQIENNVIFKGKDYAVGLERLLYRCAKCGAEFEMHTQGGNIVCDKCGNTVTYGFDGRLVASEGSVSPQRIDLWYAMQRENIRKLVEREDFCLCESVSLLVENDSKNGYKFVAKGKLQLDLSKIVFDCTQKERPIGVNEKYGVRDMNFSYNEKLGFESVEEEFLHVEFPANRCDTVAYLPGIALDLYDDKHVYRFLFDGVPASTKYALAIEEVYKFVTIQEK